jgi:hypothetical protein
MPTAAGCREAARIRFAVEQEIGGKWVLLDAAVDARSPIQAVIHTAEGEGRFRVRPTEELQAEPAVFRVPSWGPPEPEV